MQPSARCPLQNVALCAITSQIVPAERIHLFTSLYAPAFNLGLWRLSPFSSFPRQLFPLWLSFYVITVDSHHAGICRAERGDMAEWGPIPPALGTDVDHRLPWLIWVFLKGFCPPKRNGEDTYLKKSKKKGGGSKRQGAVILSQSAHVSRRDTENRSQLPTSRSCVGGFFFFFLFFAFLKNLLWNISNVWKQTGCCWWGCEMVQLLRKSRLLVS